MTNIVDELLAGIGSYSDLGRVSTSAGLIRKAAALIEELERENAELRKANQKLHRRTQAAEGKLQRMEAAHEEACRIAFTKWIDYHLYASVLLNCNSTLFPKLVKKDGIVSDAATLIRKNALEEAAKIADDYECHLMSYGGSVDAQHFYEGGMIDAGQGIAIAIRSLSDSTPTPLQEQNANMGKEGE